MISLWQLPIYPFGWLEHVRYEEWMAIATVDIRLRPLRFGFVVKPSDNSGVQSVFEINTCLWGGKYNPIIPHLTRVPRWWDRHGFPFDSAKQIMNGYVEFFEPDFLVEV